MSSAEALDGIIADLRERGTSFQRHIATELLEGKNARIERLRINGSAVQLGFVGGRYVARFVGGVVELRASADLDADLAAALTQG